MIQNKNKKLLIFLLKIVSVYLGWKLFSWFIGVESMPIEERYSPFLSTQWEAFNDIVRILLLKATAGLYFLIGYDGEIVRGYSIKADGLATVSVGNYCLGIQLWVFYIGLIISYPGKWIGRSVFILIGLISINIMNIIRIAGIAYIAYYMPDVVEFNHDYVFNGSIYLLSFGLFYLWTKRGDKL